MLRPKEQQVDHVRTYEGATVSARGRCRGRENLRVRWRGGLGQVRHDFKCSVFTANCHFSHRHYKRVLLFIIFILYI